MHHSEMVTHYLYLLCKLYFIEFSHGAQTNCEQFTTNLNSKVANTMFHGVLQPLVSGHR